MTDQFTAFPGPAPADQSADAAARPSAGVAPETGDIVIDSALSELAAVDDADLDAQLAAGETLHRTLQARLSDLGT